MPKDNNLKRKHRFCIQLNKKELDILNKFCKKYNITNKSQLIREALMKHIFDRMVEQDYPKLFDISENNTTNTTQENTNGGTVSGQVKEIPNPKLFK